MNHPTANHKSRRGFHVCSYELFYKIKQLHRWYWQTMYDFHRWHRWWRKEPQNRVGVEPTYCKAFAKREVWYRRVVRQGEQHYKVYPVTLIDDGICDLYAKARLPHSEEPELVASDVQAQIIDLYEEVAPYFTVA